MAKVHLLAGQNNAGKSNVLRFARDYLAPLNGTRIQVPSDLDVPNRGWVADLRISIGLSISDKYLDHLNSKYLDDDQNHLRTLRDVLLLDTLRKGDTDVAWFDFIAGADGLDPSPEQLQSAVQNWNEIGKNRDSSLHWVSQTWQRKLGSTIYSGADPATTIKQIWSLVDPRSALPPVKLIDAFRQIGAQVDGHEAYSGAGLIEQLAELQSPPMRDPERLAKFEKINHFVKTVLEDESARLHIPYKHDNILIETDGHTLPLSHLGTGVHEVVILASAATIIDEHLVCLEEPEVHLHPILQRRLVRYLHEYTTNTYLIATHSAHMLDANVASISHVSLNDGGTQLDAAIDPVSIARVSHDLGYRASDLVQSNCIIWVEGPSDRTYIRRWLQLVDQNLLEGIHYTIMFYGGGLLSHLTPDDLEVDEFISLRRINRNMVVVIDSDKTSKHRNVNQTKQRVIKALREDDTSLAWLTAGYTIENYVPEQLMLDSVSAAHPLTTYQWDGERFSNPLAPACFSSGRKTAAPFQPSKEKIARIATGSWNQNTEWRYDLEKRVHELAQFIRRANDLAEN